MFLAKVIPIEAYFTIGQILTTGHKTWAEFSTLGAFVFDMFTLKTNYTNIYS
jgi:hypothetical protein